MKTVVLSLGGSLIAPKGVDYSFLKKFRKPILDFIKKGNRVIIVCGGGKTCRKYINAASKITKISNENLDRLGIKATELNAELVRVIFAKYAYYKIEQDYHKKNLKFKILLSCGYLPGSSSDYDAVMWAKNYNADYLVNMTNVDYVYTKDPKYKDAKKIEALDWNTLQKIVGTKWKAGSNFPFDPIATKIAKKAKLKLAFLNGKNIKNFEKFLNGKKFKGSIIS
ncbi:UMP kinase [Candidatus Woesearchaeota archaeon B3_Woes]|nr:MAG: UMP kinase [Candidatus Woesearchaeota archaeon B3_Woes]